MHHLMLFACIYPTSHYTEVQHNVILNGGRRTGKDPCVARTKFLAQSSFPYWGASDAEQLTQLCKVGKALEMASLDQVFTSKLSNRHETRDILCGNHHKYSPE